MVAKLPTLADLRRAGTITSGEIVAAVDRYMRDPDSGPYRFPSSYSIDIAAVVDASPEAIEMKARPGPQEKAFRVAVTAAVMAACPIPP